MPDRYRCVECLKVVTATKNERYRTHTKDDGIKCIMSSAEIPPVELEAGPVSDGADPSVPEIGRDCAKCHDCGRMVALTRLGYYQHHDETLRGGVRCGASGSRYRTEETVKVDPELLGDPEARPYARKRDSEVAPISGTAEQLYDRESAMKGEPRQVLELEPGKGSQSMEPSPESTSTSKLSEPSTGDSTSSSEGSALRMGKRISERFLQPLSAFLQPPDYVKAEKVEMSEKGKEIATRLKEIFYSYNNRNTSDNRGAQTTLGPSEIGTPCDRRLAMSLMGIEPVNPGGDGWAAFVGTCTHDGLDRMFQWASGRTGRFVTEMKLTFGSAVVPKGTGDLLDRTAMMFLDHKLMGEYSLRKLREQGPSEHYRVQIHVYAYGAILAGEKVKDVAIIGWPRAGSSLDQLFVWTEPYDRKIAEDALARVGRIAQEANQKRQPLHPDGQWSAGRPLEVAREFPVGDDCKYCPFSLPKDKNMERGCPGK